MPPTPNSHVLTRVRIYPSLSVSRTETWSLCVYFFGHLLLNVGAVATIAGKFDGSNSQSGRNCLDRQNHLGNREWTWQRPLEMTSVNSDNHSLRAVAPSLFLFHHLYSILSMPRVVHRCLPGRSDVQTWVSVVTSWTLLQSYLQNGVEQFELLSLSRLVSV